MESLLIGLVILLILINLIVIYQNFKNTNKEIKEDKSEQILKDELKRINGEIQEVEADILKKDIKLQDLETT